MTGYLLADALPPPPGRPDAGRAANPFLSTEFLVTVGLLLAALLIGAVVFALVDRWRKRQTDGGGRESTESLTSYRAMFEAGELTREEYEKIRNKVAAKMKQEVGILPGGTAAPAAPAGGGSSAGTGGGEFAPGAGPPAGPTPGTGPN